MKDSRTMERGIQQKTKEGAVWWKECAVYQIYPRSFYDSDGDGIGDLNGITEKLDYLRLLGVDVLWICPVYRSPNFDNGYDISDYRAIHEDFGTMEDFDRLLAQAHARGLRIVMDLVANHTSSEHPWFIESRSGRNAEKRDYYVWRDGRNGGPPNNWSGSFGGSAWTLDPASGQYYLHIFAAEQPDLNWENPAVRQEVYDLMRFWCDKGIDGFRMDVINLISKDQRFPDDPSGTSPCAFIENGPRAHEFLREMRKAVLDDYDIMTVGETGGVTIEEAKRYAGFDTGELNMVFQFEHVGLGHSELGKWNEEKVPMPLLRENMSKWQTELSGKAWNSLYWSNHDQPRAVSRFGDDRIEYRVISAKMLATCLHFQQGTPYIYQGEELGMTNAGFERLDDYRDIESFGVYRELTQSGKVTHAQMMRFLAAKSRDNARTPMQWSSGGNGGFSKTTPWIAVNPNHRFINAEQQMSDHNSVFCYYQALLRLRKTFPVIVYGAYMLLHENSELVWAFRREDDTNELRILLNFSDQEIPYTPAELQAGEKRLIGNYKAHRAGWLQPYEAIVYIRTK